MSRIRRSIHEIQDLYDSGKDKSQLENLVKAFRGIQGLDPENVNSFFKIAGYHGLPGQANGSNPPWYCHHRNVLFPVWHRAYLYRLENALRSIEGCENVTLPYWDETRFKLLGPNDNPELPIPAVLTSRYFPLDSNEENPLYSYRLQKALYSPRRQEADKVIKEEGYTTVRYPLAGDVASDDARKKTEAHNQMYKNDAQNAALLNENITAWMEPTSGEKVDTSSVFNEFNICLDAPNYTSFSNKASATKWQAKNLLTRTVALEGPHDSMHMAVGGFTYYKTQKVQGASGDMGNNNVAAFDPIFFLHHAFIDMLFWLWQVKHNATKSGQLTVIDDPNFDGTFTRYELPGIPANSKLTMGSPLLPFNKPESDSEAPSYYTGDDLTDIKNQLDYTYSHSSLSPPDTEAGGRDTYLSSEDLSQIVCYKYIEGINHRNYRGSFIVRLMAKGPNGKVEEVDNEAVLSRGDKDNCANCQNHEDVKVIFAVTRNLIKSVGSDPDGDYSDIIFWVEIQDADNIRRRENESGRPEPSIEHLQISRD